MSTDQWFREFERTEAMRQERIDNIKGERAKPMPSFRAHIETIAHKDQRYSTCGDWQVWGYGQVRLGSGLTPTPRRTGVTMHILVSEMPDWRYMTLVAVHELAEAILCHHRGVTDEEVTAFDRLFEAEREQGAHDEHAEPGDDERCPCRKEHQFATKIERMLADELGVDWAAYEAVVEAL